MVNRGLLIKTAYEVLGATLVCGLLLMAAEGLIAYVVPAFRGQLSEQLMQFDFIRKMFGAMIGTDLGDEIGPDTFLSFPWSHPVILSLVWAHAIICCTRVPAGELEQGTIDVLLGLPISRWELLVSETVVWLSSGALVLALTLVGNYGGSLFLEPDARPDLAKSIVVLLNLFAVYLAVGGLSWLVSSFSDRRGRAITIVFVLLLASFLLNFLQQFWEPAKSVKFLSLMTYYRPILMLQSGEPPWGDLAALVGFGAVCWTAAGVMLSKRDICTL